MQKSPDCAGFSGGSIGRGNLNLSTILLICWINLGFFVYVEYQMEYLMKSLSTSPSFILDGALNGSKLTLAAIRLSQ